VRSSRSLPLAVIASICAGCESAGPAGSAEVIRTDSAGIEIIQVRSLGDRVDVLSAADVRIGSEAEGAGDSDHTAFGLISDVLSLGSGSIVVVDNRNVRVAVFDSSGAWLRDIGRRGSGPGEYTSPIYGSVHADTLFLWDQLQRRMTTYLEDGTFIESVNIARWTGASRFVAVDDGFIRGIERGQLNDPAPAEGAIVLVDREGAILDTLAGPYAVPEYGWDTDPQTGWGAMVNPPALAIAPPWSANGETFVQLDPIAGVVAYPGRSGTVSRQLRLPVESKTTTAEDRDAFGRGLQAEFGIPDEALAAELEATEFARVRPALAGLLLDDQNRVWVAEHDPGARASAYVGSLWNVHDPGTDSTARVQFPTHFDLRAVRGGRAYGVTTLDSGVHVVDVFVVDIP
jgi:hypothetical protein